MFATPLTASPAILEKSGMPAPATTGAAARLADAVRPVNTRPAAKPATTSTNESRNFRIMGNSVSMLRFQGYTSKHGIIHTSDAASKRHVDQGWRQPLPYPRA